MISPTREIALFLSLITGPPKRYAYDEVAKLMPCFTRNITHFNSTLNRLNTVSTTTEVYVLGATIVKEYNYFREEKALSYREYNGEEGSVTFTIDTMHRAF